MKRDLSLENLIIIITAIIITSIIFIMLAFIHIHNNYENCCVCERTLKKLCCPCVNITNEYVDSTQVLNIDKTEEFMAKQLIYRGVLP